MSVFPDWEKYAVPQRHPTTGCIPTGFEMLLRAAHVEGIDFSTFQEDFDLEYRGTGENSFGSVAAAIREKYPFVNMREETFATGQEKLAFVEKQLQRKQPLLVSLSRGLGQGWHIMAIVDADDQRLVLLNQMRPDGQPDTIPITKSEFATVHDTCPGGKEVAFLDEGKAYSQFHNPT